MSAKFSTETALMANTDIKAPPPANVFAWTALSVDINQQEIFALNSTAVHGMDINAYIRTQLKNSAQTACQQRQILYEPRDDGV
jgi:hypothetical protein